MLDIMKARAQRILEKEKERKKGKIKHLKRPEETIKMK